MAMVYCVHEIELRPGADPEVFEKFYADKMEPIWESVMPGGWRNRLLIGDRGARTGKYLVLIEFPSVEDRNRIAPDEGPGEYDEEFAKYEAVWAEYRQLATEPGVDTIYTDYVVVA